MAAIKNGKQNLNPGQDPITTWPQSSPLYQKSVGRDDAAVIDSGTDCSGHEDEHSVCDKNLLLCWSPFEPLFNVHTEHR